MSRNERTIAKAVELRGVGVHSGVEVTVRLKPGEAGGGVVFVRTDLPDGPSVRADVAHLVESERCTCLADGDARVSMVEHLLAALYGLGVDDVVVEVSGEEMPAGDGSALPYVELIDGAGVVDLETTREAHRIAEPVCLAEGGRTLAALPAGGGLTISYALEWWADAGAAPEANGLFDAQFCELALTEKVFRDEIAPARTFVSEADAEALRARGFGEGATYENTLVVGASGVIENELRFANEFARHKILDLIGDIALIGRPLAGRIVALKSGHALNALLAAELARASSATILDINAIQKILPHRYPFLLVDRVLQIDGQQRAVGIKNVTFNEEFFQGHWPQLPVMPGVLQIEALAQLAGILLMEVHAGTGKTAYLVGVNNVKWRRRVVPGDTLRLEIEATRMRSRGGEVHGSASVDGEVACEADIRFLVAGMA